ncbi:MAG TPA: holo-ACP synthase [Pseudogracilibacillus sp.]|nr:holo-ACP synthase [Pseudogracilibacillus sp.]
MIYGIGLDIVELGRIKRAVEKNKRFVTRILTQNEVDIYESLSTDKRKLEFLAGRFAAKEALAKALGTGIGKLSFQHIDILRQKNGAPKVSVQGYEDLTFHVSITHTDMIAAAQAYAEK